MTPGAFQKFAIFVVEIHDGNTAEYKPCAQFEGRFQTQLAKFECNEGTGQRGQFVYIRDDRVDREYFGLCEVQVFQKIGNGAKKYCFMKRRNTPLSMFSFQSFLSADGRRVPFMVVLTQWAAAR